jgi:hypothetical protein
MVEEDLSALASVELMRRLVAKLPEGSSEQAQLFSVIKGLSTVSYFGQAGSGKPWDSGGEGRARQVLRAILPKLSEEMPGDPLVIELTKRFTTERGKG